MNFLLTRYEFSQDGIFGVLTALNFKCETLEHAYAFPEYNTYIPKLSPGTYNCVRGKHQLAHMDHEFETFEIMNVPNHTDILFHVGNENKDSAGCVLVATTRQNNEVLFSATMFAKFMETLNGINQFTLEVRDAS